MYTYNEFLEDVVTGYEFHFELEGKQYSISYLRNGDISIGEMDTDDFTDYDNKFDMLYTHKINGKTFEENFDDMLFHSIL